MKAVWDQTVKGLHLRTMTTGRQSFYLYYRTKQGQQRKPKIGDVHLGWVEARKVAKNLLKIVSDGGDPSGDWKRAREEFTINELFAKTWDQHWSQEQYQKSSWSTDVKCNYDNHIRPCFGSLRFSEVTPGRIREWHTTKSAIPCAANRSLETLSKIFTFAEEREWIPQGTNPCKLVRAFTEVKRNRYASNEELKAIAGILDREAAKYPRQVAFIYLLLMTGARPKSIECSTWNNLRTVELDGESFGILEYEGKSTHKTGDAETLVIPTLGMKILNSLPRASTITGIKMPTAFWKKIRKEVGCPDLWARDFRRTYATLGLSEGLDVGILGELLNHKDPKTTKRYAKLNLDSRIKVAKKINKSITEITQKN